MAGLADGLAGAERVGAVGAGGAVLPGGGFDVGDGEGGDITAEVALHGADDLALEGCGQQVGTGGLGKEGGVGEEGSSYHRSEEEGQAEEESTGSHRPWGMGGGFNLVWVGLGENEVELRILQRLAVGLAVA